MPVLAVHKDPEALTMTVTAEFAATADRVWSLWSDPRQLERWWGPPTHPATFVDHDLSVGGRASYYMTGPDGEKFHGWWNVSVVEPPKRIVFEDGFADDAGQPVDDMSAIHTEITIAEIDGKTRMTNRSTFASTEAMEEVLAMGAEEGAVLAIDQIDAILLG